MNEERNKIQKKVRILSRKYPYLALIFATRTGKTVAALKVIDEHGGSWNIVVAERQHIDQWKKEIIYFGMEKYLKHINIFCYASLHKHLDASIAINWIFDEAHHMFTKRRWKMITSQAILRALFLSPKLNEEEYDQLRTFFNPLKILGLSLTTAIKKNIISAPIIYLVPLTLNKSKVSQAFKLKTGNDKKRVVFNKIAFKDRFKYLGKYKDLNLSIICTEQQKYDLIINQLDYKKEIHAKYKTNWTKLSLLRIGLERKKFLAQIKTPYIQQFLKTIKDERFVCFTSNIQQCERLGGSNNIIHSKRKLNSLTLDRFNNNKINSLFVVDMLTEGTNLLNVDIGIIIQLDAIERHYIQKSGRVYLGNYPKQYIFYYKNTSDEFLVKRIIRDKLDPKYIKEISFSKLIKT